MEPFRPFIARVAGGQPLSREEAVAAFDRIMSGEATPAQIGGFLVALRLRGETVDEIAAAVEVMRAKMLRVSAPAGAVDVVGTGGDGSGSYNVSTCAAFIVAGCGVPVAKHGNRALSSKSGAADVLGALGVNTQLSADAISNCITEAGIGFMFAPNHHSAMRHVGAARAELGIRTVFNLIGPLSNPAGVQHHLLGVFARSWVEPIAEALQKLGAGHSWVVHGSDGLDEITTTGPTAVAELRDGEVRSFEITPEDAGLARAAPEDLKGGDGEHNAAALRAVLHGEPGAYRDIAIFNAAAALLVAGHVPDILSGAEAAARSIDDGEAFGRLERLIIVSNRAAP